MASASKESLEEDERINVTRVARNGTVREYTNGISNSLSHYCRETRGKSGAIDQDEKLDLPRFSLIATKGKSERDIKRERSIGRGKPGETANERGNGKSNGEIKRLGLCAGRSRGCGVTAATLSAVSTANALKRNDGSANLP